MPDFCWMSSHQLCDRAATISSSKSGQKRTWLLLPPYMNSSSNASSEVSFGSDRSAASIWLDETCLKLSIGDSDWSGSGMCPACSNFFRFNEPMREYQHIRLLSTLRANATNGCRLCDLALSKIHTEKAESEAIAEIRLTYLIDDSLVQGATELFVSYESSYSSFMRTELDSEHRACFVIRLMKTRGEYTCECATYFCSADP